jgi:D-alanyl-D-alanine dipeptidase
MTSTARACRAAIVSAAFAALAPPLAIAQSSLPPGLVYLRDIDPTIAQDMRYAGFDNFVGRPLPGYDAPECILRHDAAAALKRVQADLAPSGLSLKVYDCYRPLRAVYAMAAWANDGRSETTTKRFFPKLHKSALFGLGYIASHSQHPSGNTVDLTLIARTGVPAATFDAKAAYGPCTAPAAERSPDNSIDMGTGFDCFDPASYTASTLIGAEQRRQRRILVDAMRREGFRNYFREWWHFSYSAPGRSYDFSIRSRITTAAH